MFSEGLIKKCIINDIITKDRNVSKPLNLPKSFLSTSDPEIGAQLFKQDEPHVLLLSFRTPELAKDYYMKFFEISEVNEPVLHQTILLCTTSEVKEAVQLATKDIIDDYLTFNPIHDPYRLYLCIRHALERRAEKIKFETLKKELSERQTQLKAAENFTHEMRHKNTELQEESIQSREKLVQGVEGKLSQFEQKMSDRQFSDAVEVIDQKKLSQHFSRLKNEELQSDFETFDKDLNHSHDRLLGELNEYIQQFERRSDRYTRPKISILIIDDDPKSIKLLSAMLEPEGHRVHSATDIKHAIILGVRRRPDLILMDVMMPEINGIELTRRFKRHPKLKEIPIVMVTAHPSTKVIELSAKMGASDLIAKPVRRSVLLEKIEQVFDKGKPQ